MTRLGRYMDSHPDLYNLNLLEDRYSVCVRACGGLQISRLARDRDLLSFDVSPDIALYKLVKMTYFRLVWKLSYVTSLP